MELGLGLLLGLGLTGGYVSALYILPHQLSRDDKQTIQKRMVCTVGYCCIAWTPVYLFLGRDFRQFLCSVGLAWNGMRKAVVFPLLTTMLLFFGPLVQQLGVNSFKERYSEPYSMDPAMWRDLVVAPLTEEFIFRCLTTAILLRMGFSPGAAVFVAPLFFGVAHLHHLRDYICHKGLPMCRAVSLVAFQFVYTSLFGWLAAWYFIRYRHVLAAVIPHAFCNLMGAPDILAISRHPQPCFLLGCYLAGIVCFSFVLYWQSAGESGDL